MSKNAVHPCAGEITDAAKILHQKKSWKSAWQTYIDFSQTTLQ